MPLTDYQKQWALQKAGYDPTKFTLGDDGYISPVAEQQQPTISGDSMVPNKPSPTPNTYSPAQTFGMSLGQAAPGTIGGGLGAAGGLAAASWLLGPEVGLPVSLGAMLGGGLLGSTAAKKAQNIIEPEAWTQAAQEASTENPKSAIAGQLASLPLAGFSPSPTGVLRGLGGGAKILTGMEATAPELGAFRNLAFNTTLGAAQPTIDYALGQGPAPTVGGTLESAGIGALFNKPNAIGNRLGFGHPEIANQLPNREALLAALQNQEQVPQTTQPQVQTEPSIDDLVAAYGLPQSRQEIVSGKLATVAQRSDKMAGYRAIPEAPDISTFEGEGGTVPKETLSPEEVKLEQERQTRIRDFSLAKQELENSELEKSVALLNQHIKLNRLQAEQTKVSPLYETETGVQAMPDYTGVTEHDNAVNQQESAVDLEARKLEAKLSGEEQPKYQEESAFPTKTVSPDHLSVKEAIDTLKTKTDDASILPEDAAEIHKILKLQVDWSKMPEVGKLLHEPNADPLDPDLWVKVQDEYNKYLNAPKAQQAPKADIVTSTRIEQVPTENTRIKQTSSRAKNPALAGDKALESFKGNLPKQIGPNDLQPKEGERISPNSSEGLRQIWKEIDAGNHQAAMNRIEYAYRDANPDTRQVLKAQMYVIEKKSGITPSEQFKTDNPKYQTDSKAQEIKSKLDKEGVDINNVKEWNKVITDWAKPRFGIEISEDGNITNSQTGKPVAGQAYLRNALREAFIKINPEKAGIDTLPHELHHVFMDYLERFGSTSDKKFIHRAYTKVESTPEYQAAKAENPSIDPNEFLASKGGLEFIDRQLNLQGHNEWKTFWKDYIAHLKDKFTNKASLEDYQRLLNYKMIHDPLYEGSAFNGTATTNQTESQLKNKSPDKIRYEEIQARMSDLIKQGNTGDEFKNLWREMEDIKNRQPDKGMPPKNQDESELGLSKKGEGKTPYPFRLKELVKGEQAKEDIQNLHQDSLIDASKSTEFQDIKNVYNQKSAFNNPERNQDISSLNPFRSEVTRVRQLEHPEADKVADAFDKFYATKRAYVGSMVNEATGKLLNHINYKNPKELLHLDNTDLQAVKAYFDDKADGITPKNLTPEQQAIKDEVSASLKAMADKANSIITLPRTIKINPDYLPQMMSRKSLETLLNKGGTPEHTKLIKDWYDYYTNTLGKTKAEADTDLQTLKDSFKGEVSKNIAAQFGPIDKAAGLGLPRSWRENNLVDILSRFGNRYARRLSYHEAIETNPDVSKLLNDPIEGIAAQKNVKNITDDIAGIRDFSEQTRTAALGLIRSAMLGPLTGAKDFVSNLTLGFQHQTPTQAIRSPIEAWKNLSNNIAESFETGVNRYNISNLELGEGGIQDITNLARRAGDIINLVQGRNYLERINRATAYGQGRFLAMDNMQSHASGNLSKTGEKFLDDFGPKNWRTKTSLTPEELKETAAKYTESVQGTYDYRGLPAVAMKGSFSPYLALARWNIEKFNNFNKYVIEPAKRGNITPLLMQTIGMLIGGEAVTKLVELATNKKEKTPQISELKALYQDPDANFSAAIAYKLAGLSSLSGYGGIMGDVIKSVFDKSFHNRPQTWDNPLIGGIENAGQHIFNVVEALQAGNFDIGADALNAVLQDYFQSYRLALNQLSPEQKEELARQDKFRDLRLFKSTHGMDTPSSVVDTPNPYLNKDATRFKKTSDMDEAMELLPNLIEKAFKDADGNVEILRSKLESIKLNSYQTMPSPQNIPRTFLTYLNYLSETQGADAASERLSDYLMQEGLNKMKSSMVPKF